MAWQSVKMWHCIGVSEVLMKVFAAEAMLSSAPPRSIPEVTGELLDLGQTIAEDDAFWDSLPEVIAPPLEIVEKRQKTVRDIAERCTNALDKAYVESMMDAMTLGEKKDELRELLRETLKDCRV